MVTMKPRTETVTLWQGDDLAELERLRAAIDDAQNDTPVPLIGGEKDPAVSAAEAYNRLYAKAAKRAVTVTIQAVPRTRWRELVAANPPREGDETDALIGMNAEEFGDALLAEPDTIINPPEVAGPGRREFVASLSDGDWQLLVRAAYAVNRSTGEAPKAFPVSELTSNSGETSN